MAVGRSGRARPSRSDQGRAMGQAVQQLPAVRFYTPSPCGQVGRMAFSAHQGAIIKRRPVRVLRELALIPELRGSG